MDIACAMDTLEEGKAESQELKVEQARENLTEDQPTVVDRKVRLAHQTEVENLKRVLVDVRFGISHLKREVERLKTINADVSDEAYLILKEVHRLRTVVKGARYRSSLIHAKDKDLMELREVFYTTVEHMCSQNAVLKAENEDLRKDDKRLREIIEIKSETENEDLTQNTENDLLPMSRLENENSIERQKENKGQSPNVALDWEWWESNDLCVADGSRTNVESDAGSTDNIIDWEWWGPDVEFRVLCWLLEGKSFNDVYKKQGETSQPDSSDVIG